MVAAGARRRRLAAPLPRGRVASLATGGRGAATPRRTGALGGGDEAIAGTPLWLRAEPGEDAAMAEAMAADIAAWSRTCGIS